MILHSSSEISEKFVALRKLLSIRYALKLCCYCRHVVLDEADQMLERGFADSVEEILAASFEDALSKGTLLVNVVVFSSGHFGTSHLSFIESLSSFGSHTVLALYFRGPKLLR